MIELTLPKWYDLHVHFRQGEQMASYVKAHIDMGCAGALAMPNTKPPVAVVYDSDEKGNYWSVERYMRDLRAAGADVFDVLIVPLYLTNNTTPEMIEKGAKDGILKACKAYPPHGTTGAEFGAPVTDYMDSGVFEVMEEAGVVLCVHGEEHAMPSEKYFDQNSNAEKHFYEERLPRIRDRFPNLRIVCEHITTKEAVKFVKESGDNVAASVTPQHLIHTIGDLIQGLKYHLYCMPILKFEQDRQAIREAVTGVGNKQFFAGTDSAPHTTKATECGCAAGCFTGGVAPQLYAHGFELAGVDMASNEGQKIFKSFLCDNGAVFYDLDECKETFTLVKTPSDVEKLFTPEGSVVPLPLGINQSELSWSVRP